MVESININNDDEYCEVLKSGQEVYTENNDTHKDSIFFRIYSSRPNGGQEFMGTQCNH